MDKTAYPARKPRSVQFTLSLPGSAASSRAPSPAPAERAPYIPPPAARRPSLDSVDSLDSPDDKYGSSSEDDAPGRRARDVYDAGLAWWQAAVRRRLVRTVRWESVVIARMQDRIRTPWLDAYFVYSSTLGTHTFFMTILPALFFFGFPELGRGLVLVLGLGIYGSSVLKDLFCSPRPFAPPVTRLTIGTHHLEYGFPSTHSTNSVSIALFFFAEVHRLASSDTPVLSYPVYIALCALLAVYAFTVVFGRLYTAMHSFTDCITGIVLGAAIWWWQTAWAGIPLVLAPLGPSSPFYTQALHAALGALGIGAPQPGGGGGGGGGVLVHLGAGLGAGAWIEGLLQRSGWALPLVLVPLCLLAVHVHPQPVDDCPCFEDAIAILSVVLGALVSRWAMCFVGAGAVRGVVMPGSGWARGAGGVWESYERGLGDVLLWWGIAAVKMAFGIFVIFAWRLLAKAALHRILPPTFRLLARAVRLPHRRFYTPATQYTRVPSEFRAPAGAHAHADAEGDADAGAARDGSGFTLHPIPSVIDLPGAGGVSVEVGGIGSGVRGVSRKEGGVKGLLKNRNGAAGAGYGNGNAASGNANGNGGAGGNGSSGSGNGKEESRGKDAAGRPVKHYDADVLTKVIVYVGIAVLAMELLPLGFDLVGAGVRSSPPY